MPKAPKKMAIPSALLRLLREAKNMTQEEFARLAGISVATLSRYESGKFHLRLPSAPQVLRALQISEQEFLALEQQVRAFAARGDAPYPLPGAAPGSTASWVAEGGVPSFAPYANVGGLWLVLNFLPPAAPPLVQAAAHAAAPPTPGRSPAGATGRPRRS